MRSNNCPRCQGSMSEGFILDNYDARVHNVWGELENRKLDGWMLHLKGQEQPIRIKGQTLSLATQMGILVTLSLTALSVVYKAGGITRQQLIDTAAIADHVVQLREITKALTTVQAITEAQALGKEADQASLSDIRSRLSALEAKP